MAGGHRALVFSQFTGFLKRVRTRLDRDGIGYCYLDGRTRNRQDVIEKFRSGTDPVFLISLKAGGLGLNLTEADYCILLDPWWNPATETQAVDRAHRIGQTKTVMVYRLVAKDTIEEKVALLKADKTALFDGVLGDRAGCRRRRVAHRRRHPVADRLNRWRLSTPSTDGGRPRVRPDGPGSATRYGRPMAAEPAPEREVLSWELFGSASRELAQSIADSGFRPGHRGGDRPRRPAARRGARLRAGDEGRRHPERRVLHRHRGDACPTRWCWRRCWTPTRWPGKKLLVVDDVADSGRTLDLVMRLLAEHTTDARSAVLYTKSRTIIQPDYSWRATDLWITFPWSAHKPVVAAVAAENA